MWSKQIAMSHSGWKLQTAVFRDNGKVGDQVAILVDRDEEGVPFLIGDVIGIVQGPGPLKIQWFSPAVKKSGDGQVDS